MRKVPTLRYPWNSLATVLLAVALFMPAKELVAQMPAAGASLQAQEFTQNVKEVYFPFNVYNRIVDPAVLNSDADRAASLDVVPRSSLSAMNIAVTGCALQPVLRQPLACKCAASDYIRSGGTMSARRFFWKQSASSCEQSG